MSTIQSIVFENKLYDTKKARKWLKEHGYMPSKRVHKSHGRLRYRIKEPNNTSDYRIIRLDEDIYAVIEI